MRTMNSYSAVQLRWLKAWGALALGVVLLAGCASRQEKAIDQAKKQAAATGQAQQVISVATDGTTTTTIVQPPVPGQAGQAVTTTVAPGPANRSEEHTSELQSLRHLVCRLLLEKK